MSHRIEVLEGQNQIIEYKKARICTAFALATITFIGMIVMSVVVQAARLNVNSSAAWVNLAKSRLGLTGSSILLGLTLGIGGGGTIFLAVTSKTIRRETDAERFRKSLQAWIRNDDIYGENVADIIERFYWYPFPGGQLDLDSKDLRTLPDCISELQGLQELDLRYNPQLTVLPESFATLTELRVLDIRYTGITVIPESIRQLPNLRILFDHRVVESGVPVPEELAEWVSAAEAGENRRAAALIIKEFMHSNLTILELTNLGLRSLPDNFGNLPRMDLLRQLNLDGNNLEGLPESFEELHSINWISMGGGNLVVNVPDALFQRLPVNIKDAINLNRWLFAAPEGEERVEAYSRIYAYTQGRSNALDLSNLGLRSLPELSQIPRMNMLIRLDLSNNHLTTLPHSISALPILRELITAGNPLEEVCELFTAFSRLMSNLSFRSMHGAKLKLKAKID